MKLGGNKVGDNIKMNSHKLIYHPETVSKWMKGENIYPIEVEISPSGACNHRCTFCAVDYIGYKPDFLEKENLLKNIDLMKNKGLKSVICSGEGEPLLNKEMPNIANGMKALGVDVAMSSNGVLLSKEISKECLKAFTWIRFSVASMEEESYNLIQRGKKDDLSKVKENLYEAVRVKKTDNLNTTLGVQCLLLPQNADKVVDMAKQLREIGVDYFTIKPFSQHLHSNNKYSIDYSTMLDLEKELASYKTEKFNVIFRANSINNLQKEKCYGKCYGLPFMTHIDARGNVWPCVAHIGDEKFCYGNIYEQTFEEIWEGNKRKEVMKLFDSLDINKNCRESCRLDQINQYLSELKNPGSHINFI